MIQRGNFSAERMISTAKRARFFQRKNVSRLFGDAEQISRSRWVGADFADFAGREKSTQVAGSNRVPRARNRTRNLLRLIAPRSHHPERNPLGGARADSRQLPQL